MKKTLWLTPLIFASMSATANNPFTYREPEPVATAEQTLTVSQTNLSDEQKTIVLDLIAKAIEASALKGSDAIQSVDGEPTLVLKEGQRHVGLSSGMHVIYDENVNDYLFFDSKQYKRVIKGSEILSMRENALSNVRNLLLPSQSSTPPTHQVGAPVKPVSLSSQGN